MFVTNPSADRRPYDAELRAQLSQAQARAARGRLAAWDGLCPFPTPAWPMPGLARALGIASLTIKDESCRSALGSFKALGAPHALVKLLQRRFADRGWSAAALLTGQRHRRQSWPRAGSSRAERGVPLRDRAARAGQPGA
jgi:hypothetical protein